MNRGVKSEAGSRRCWLRAALAGCLVCGLGMVGVFVSAVPAMAASPAAALSPSPASLDFGTVDMHFQQSRQEATSIIRGRPRLCSR